MAEDENPASEPQEFRRDFAYDGGGVFEAGLPIDEQGSGLPNDFDASFNPEPDAGTSAPLDPTEQTPDRAGDVDPDGDVRRIAYDAAHDELHVISQATSELIRIDLVTRAVLDRVTLSIAPTDLCVDSTRASVFVVGDAESGVILELGLASYALIREIPWTAAAAATNGEPHFHVRCGGDRLWLVDAEWGPGLWSLQLDDANAVPVWHGEAIDSVGDVAYDATADALFTVVQFGWGAGNLGSDIVRYDAQTLTQTASTGIGYPDFLRDPVDAPLVYDAVLGVVAAKRHVFAADDLSLPLHVMADGELVLAIDSATNRIVTSHNVYDATSFALLAPLVVRGSRLAFFDDSGALYAYSSTARAFYVQEP